MCCRLLHSRGPQCPCAERCCKGAATLNQHCCIYHQLEPLKVNYGTSEQYAISSYGGEKKHFKNVAVHFYQSYVYKNCVLCDLHIYYCRLCHNIEYNSVQSLT